MDQLLKSFGIEWKLLIWQVINFGILFFILSRLLYKPLQRFISERERKVAESVRSAEALEQRSKQLEEDLKKEMQRQRHDLEEMHENTRKTNEKLRADLKEQAESEAKRIIAEAKLIAAEEKTQILSSLEHDVRHLTVEVASKLLEKEINEEQNRKFIQEALASLRDKKQ